MTLSTGNLRGYLQKLDLTEARVKHKVTQTYRNIIEGIFTDIVQHTPQFSGNLTYGWQIVFGPYSAQDVNLHSSTARNTMFREYTKDNFEPYEAGDDPAAGLTLARELGKLADIRYNSIVKIVNTVEYAEDVDAGEGPKGHDIRPENLHYGKVFMATYAEVKYGRMKNLIKVAR